MEQRYPAAPSPSRRPSSLFALAALLILIPSHNCSQLCERQSPITYHVVATPPVIKHQARQTTTSTANVADKNAASNVTSFVLSPEQTHSLQGTDIDGGLTTDSQGNFVADQRAIRLFDYFFLATGEMTKTDIIASIAQQIRQRLSDRGATQALAFLKRYVNYRDAAKALFLTGGDNHSFAERARSIKQLRSELFGEPLRQQLFGNEELVNSLTLKRLAVSANTELSKAELDQQVNDIIAKLPDVERQAYYRSLQPGKLREAVEQLKQQQASEDQIWTLREQTYGAQAADRLARMDLANQQWQQKVSYYRLERSRIVTDQKLPIDVKQQKVNQLRARLFSATQITRIRALDAIEKAPLSAY